MENNKNDLISSENNTSIDSTNENISDENLSLIDSLIGKERINEIIKAINTISSQYNKAKLEQINLEKLKLENEVILSKIKSETLLQEQKFISKFDVRGKIYAIISMLIILSAVYFYFAQGSIDKEFTKTIVILLTSIIGIGGVNILQESINKRK